MPVICVLESGKRQALISIDWFLHLMGGGFSGMSQAVTEEKREAPHFKYPCQLAKGELPRGFHHLNMITDEIAIGPLAQAQQVSLMKNVGSILSLVDCNILRDVRKVTYVYPPIHLKDGPGNSFEQFENAVETLRERVNETPPVFVHCYVGISRSAAVVAAYLATSRDISLDEALEFISQKRPEICVNPALLELAERYIQAFYGKNDSILEMPQVYSKYPS